MSIFESAGAGFFPAEKGARAYTTIVFDDNVMANFTMIDESQGSQASRVQIDATLDGKLHVIGTTTGVGSYSAVFFDGPICGEKRDSAMQKYLSLKSLKARTATVYFYNSAKGMSTKQTSAATAKFSGVLTNMAVSMSDENGVIYIRVALGIAGSWGSSGI